MNKITKTISATFLSLALLNNVCAQELKHCGSTEMQQAFWDANPDIYQDYLKENARLEAIDKAAFANGYKDNNRTSAPTYIIPVVFHIIHQNGTENISDAQIKDAIRVMNNDWRKQNADTANTAASFKGKEADIGVEFRLAQKAPDGSCTNGIERIVSSLTNQASDNSKLTYWDKSISQLVTNAVKGNWPASKYLNIWTAKSIGVPPNNTAAYANYPSGNGTSISDGIISLSNYVGSIGSSSPFTSRTLTHEAGHYLNLAHVWGSTNSAGVDCSGTDYVSDTPTTKGHNNQCPLSDETCNPGVIENVQNYMDYSYCSTMFTAGQKTRMLAALTGSVGARNSLWTAANLTATGVSTPAVLCKADFQSNSMINTVCQGNSLTFTDLSWNATPTSWSWTFSGGTPATSSAQSPVIQYTSAGTYDVALTATNSSGSVSATKTAYVTVNPSTATYSNAFYSEGFEGAAIPNTDWSVNNAMPGGNTWTQTTAAAVTGTKSVRIVNNSSYDTYVDELMGPSVDMTLITGSNPILSFKVANAQKATSGLGSADKLQVYVSTNCGLSWTLRKTLSGAGLSTAGVNATWTIPTASEWVTQSTLLSGYTSQANLYFMFRFISNGGNNVYIDDINISGTTGIQDEIANNLDFNVYPNPSQENTMIAFTLLDKQKVEIKMYDVLGRVVSSVIDGNLNAGEHQYLLTEKANLSPGIYFVKLTVGEESFTKKLIIK